MIGTIWVVILCFIYAICNVTGATLIKSEIGSSNLSVLRDYISFLFTARVLAGFIIISISALIIIKALSMERFSFVIPTAQGVNFALTVLVGYFVFGDQLKFGSYAGLLLILAGIVLMGINAQ